MGVRRAALVLGATGDIGGAIARKLAADGIDVVLSGRHAGRLHALAATIEGAEARAIAADLSEQGAARNLADQAAMAFGRLDILVTAAAQFRQGTVLDLSADDWAEGFAAMFFGAVEAVRTAWPHLAAARGQIVLVSGVFAIRPAARSVLPSAIAAALLNFAKSTAELGLRDGVAVNCVLPGPVSGRRLDEQLVRFAAARGLEPADAAAAYAAQFGIDRLGDPDDIANAVLFLVSAEAAQIRGASLVIDGGITRAV